MNDRMQKQKKKRQEVEKESAHIHLLVSYRESKEQYECAAKSRPPSFAVSALLQWQTRLCLCAFDIVLPFVFVDLKLKPKAIDGSQCETSKDFVVDEVVLGRNTTINGMKWNCGMLADGAMVVLPSVHINANVPASFCRNEMSKYSGFLLIFKWIALRTRTLYADAENLTCSASTNLLFPSRSTKPPPPPPTLSPCKLELRALVSWRTLIWLNWIIHTLSELLPLACAEFYYIDMVQFMRSIRLKYFVCGIFVQIGEKDPF